MLEAQPLPMPIATNPQLAAYLEYNRKLQTRAWVFSAIPIVIVVAAVLSGTIQLKHLRQNINSARTELEQTQESLVKAKSDITVAENRRAALRQEVNAAIALSPTPVQTTARLTPFVLGKPVKISVILADPKKQAEANKAKEVMESHGYTVNGIEERPQDVTHETTVRFFLYDRSTVAIGKDMVKLLQGVGFKVRTEFDDEFVGQPSAPPPGTYEIWIGIDPSYNPPGPSPSR